MKYCKIVKYKTYPLTKKLQSKKMSFRELSRRTGIDVSYLTRLEKGAHIASQEIAKKIIKELS